MAQENPNKKELIALLAGKGSEQNKAADRLLYNQGLPEGMTLVMPTDTTINDLVDAVAVLQEIAEATNTALSEKIDTEEE